MAVIVNFLLTCTQYYYAFFKEYLVCLLSAEFVSKTHWTVNFLC